MLPILYYYLLPLLDETFNRLFPVLGGKTPSMETSPVWIPDSDAKACMLCNTPFTVINRRVSVLTSYIHAV